MLGFQMLVDCIRSLTEQEAAVVLSRAAFRMSRLGVAQQDIEEIVSAAGKCGLAPCRRNAWGETDD